MKIMARVQQWGDSIELVVTEGRRSDDGFSVGRLVMEVLPRGGFIGEPTLTISQTEAQQLMDELWQCGLRPSEGSGSAGSLAATERHLNDMQTIAMGLLRKSGVGVAK